MGPDVSIIFGRSWGWMSLERSIGNVFRDLPWSKAQLKTHKSQKVPCPIARTWKHSSAPLCLSMNFQPLLNCDFLLHPSQHLGYDFPTLSARSTIHRTWQILCNALSLHHPVTYCQTTASPTTASICHMPHSSPQFPWAADVCRAFPSDRKSLLFAKEKAKNWGKYLLGDSPDGICGVQLIEVKESLRRFLNWPLPRSSQIRSLPGPSW